MNQDPIYFVFCQKLVIFRNNDTEVLLACRKGEQDYDQTYTFIGGKLETTDGGIVEGIKREKNEEAGEKFKISINPTLSFNAYYVKRNGDHVILPHYYAQHVSGDVVLSDEYSDYKWVPLSELEAFEPRVENIPEIANKLLKLKQAFDPKDFVAV